MEGYQTEEQQLVVLHEFWKRNRLFILSLIVLFCVILFGTQMYRRYEVRQAEQASILYQEVLSAVQKTDVNVAKTKGALLLKKYSRTPYAALGAMILAKISIDEEDLPTAIDKFRYIVKNSAKNPLWHVAKIKLARLLHANKEHQEALKELDNPPNGYVQLYEELKGDIYVTLKDLDKARESYRKAISNANGNPVPWLEMKLTNINTVEDALKKGVIDGPAIKTNS